MKLIKLMNIVFMIAVSMVTCLCLYFVIVINFFITEEKLLSLQEDAVETISAFVLAIIGLMLLLLWIWIDDYRKCKNEKEKA